MKENFVEILEKLQPIGIVRVCSDFYMQPNHKHFVKSSATLDKTNSLRLYPATNTFCDFVNGRLGGDMIRLVSYVRRIDNWAAAGELMAFYRLSDSKEQAGEDIRARKRGSMVNISIYATGPDKHTCWGRCSGKTTVW